MATRAFRRSLAPLLLTLLLAHGVRFGWGKDRVCPSPPTVNSLNASAYTGLWYEIGTSARFKFQRENGLVCNQANYQLVFGDSESNVTIRVVNSGVVRANFFVTSAVSGIASANRNISSSVDGLKNTSSTLSSTVKKLSKIQGIPEDVKRQAVFVKEEIAAQKKLVRLLCQEVSDTQRVAGKLTQLQLPLQDIHSQIQSLVAQLKATASALEESNSKVESASARIRAALGPEGEWNGTQKSIQRLDQGISCAVSETRAALEEIRHGIQEVSRASDSVASGDGSALIQYRVSVVGQAVQDPEEKGKLTVSFPLFGPPPSSPNYWIIGLEGKEEQGYDAALIYSCELVRAAEGDDVTPDISLFIISRRYTPLESATKAKFFGILKDNKIQLGCDNPFVYTFQDPSKCGYQQHV